MAAAPDLRSLKRRVSPRLLAIPGVSGVGLPGGRLTVYLERDSDDVRRAVRRAVDLEQEGTALDFVVGGRFRAR